MSKETVAALSALLEYVEGEAGTFTKTDEDLRQDVIINPAPGRAKIALLVLRSRVALRESGVAW